MIATENNNHRFTVREAVQAVSLAIDSFQLKIDRGRA